MSSASRKRSRVTAEAGEKVDQQDDNHVSFALGNQSDDDLPGSKKKRPPPPPESKELDLEKLIFGGGSSLLSMPAQDDADDSDDQDDTGVKDDGNDEERESNRHDAMADDQLFMLDTGVDEEEDVEDELVGLKSSAIGRDLDADDEKEDTSTYTSSHQQPPKPKVSRPKKCVWSDPDDASMTVALAGREAMAADGSRMGRTKLRKLREEVGENSISGLEYELRLRKQFEKLHPRPMWASLRLLTRARSASPGAETSNDPTLSDLLQSDSGLLDGWGSRNDNHDLINKSLKARGKLKAGEIEVERLRNANDAQTTTATIHDESMAAIEMVQFHPSSRTSVLMTASRDRRVRLFQIDGKANPLLQTIHVPDLPIQTACFHPSGSSVLISGTRPFLYSYDLQAGRVIRSQPWRGSGSVLSSSSGGADEGIERDLSLARFQPGTGEAGNRLLAIGGRRGQVHLLDWGRSGSAGGARIGGFRMNSPLAGLCWDPSSTYDRAIGASATTTATSSSNDHQLLTLSTEGKVHIWDIRNSGTEVGCVSIWTDPGSFGAKGLHISPTGRFWAVGSDSGIVNVYKRPTSSSSSFSIDSTLLGNEREIHQGPLQPIKAMENLTTASTTVTWNHDAQILALASRNKKDALKLVHFPSMRVFSNWPTSGTPLGHVTSVDFSTSSQYLAIGNSRGKVLLYGLRHYM